MFETVALIIALIPCAILGMFLLSILIAFGGGR